MKKRLIICERNGKDRISSLQINKALQITNKYIETCFDFCNQRPSVLRNVGDEIVGKVSLGVGERHRKCSCSRCRQVLLRISKLLEKFCLDDLVMGVFPSLSPKLSDTCSFAWCY